MTKRYRLVGIVLAVFLVLALLLTACSDGETEQATEEKDMITEILERGTLRVGVGTFIPWAFQDKDGNLVGYEIDVATELANDMGVDVEFYPTDWAGIIPAMLTGKFDIIISGMGITTERATKVNFTIPYEYSGLEVLCSKHTAPNITSPAQLNDPDMRLAIGVSGTPVTYADKYLPLAQQNHFSEQKAQVQDILNGNSDCSMVNPPQFYRDVRDHPDDLYMPFGVDYLGKEAMGFALPKGDPEAVLFFNSWITTSEPFLTDRAEYWFTQTEWEELLPEEG